MTPRITDSPPTPTLVERLREAPNISIYIVAMPASVRDEAADLIDELVALAIQYRNDLRYPPASDSVERRLAAIEAAITKAQP